MKQAGRPVIYNEDTVLQISSKEAKTKLQQGSERRAIVNYIIDCRGRATLGELDAHFGFETKPRVMALVQAGWLEIEI